MIEMMSLGRERTAEELGFFVGVRKPLLCLEVELSIHAMEEFMSFKCVFRKGTGSHSSAACMPLDSFDLSLTSFEERERLCG